DRLDDCETLAFLLCPLELGEGHGDRQARDDIERLPVSLPGGLQPRVEVLSRLLRHGHGALVTGDCPSDTPARLAASTWLRTPKLDLVGRGQLVHATPPSSVRASRNASTSVRR